MVLLQSKERAIKHPDQATSKSNQKLLKIGALVSIIAGAIILVYPFIPLLRYKLFPPSPTAYTSMEEYARQNNSGFFDSLPLIGDRLKEQTTGGNRLIIPKIGVNSPIVEGLNDRALLRGAWRYPSSSTPDKGGNTVITGHRFRFRPPNNTTFYLLDKISVNDEIVVIWENKEYRYKVKETKVVNPDQTEILNNTDQAILTLYTCTPLFTTKQRLVVVSELV